jgi:hypothetical protein
MILCAIKQGHMRFLYEKGRGRTKGKSGITELVQSSAARKANDRGVRVGFSQNAIGSQWRGQYNLQVSC